MSACERTIDVEDLVLGLTKDAALEAHLETCAECRRSKHLFEQERALFAAREVPPPPPLALRSRRLLPRIAPLSAAFVGIAAAIAMLAYRRPVGLTAECEAPQMIAVSSESEPLLCEAPSPAPAMTLASHESRLPACIESDRAICAEPDWLVSSSALP
jgi:hypothetical protein